MVDIRYWAGKMKRARVIPELEIFDLSMIESVMKLADEGSLDRPLHFNFSSVQRGARRDRRQYLQAEASLPSGGPGALSMKAWGIFP